MATRKPKPPAPPPRAPLTPAAAISAEGILGLHFAGQSWNRWRAVLKGAYGEPLTPAEDVLFREVAERDPPTAQVQELWCVAGRRAGKDSVASAIATIASLGDYSDKLRPGERATVMCLASTRHQATIVFRYILGYFEETPLLKALLLRSSDDTIELANGAEIIVTTNSFRAVRGRSVVVAILDEVAFFRSDESANPDSELYNALLPAMATFPNALLIGISSPYRRRGLLFDKWRKSYGQNDPDVLVVRGASRVFNETLRQKLVDDRLAADPEAGAAEYLAEWRSDLSDFLDRELVESAVDTGVVVRPRHPHYESRCFIDASGGRGDSFTAAIAHAEGSVSVLDSLYERRAPFNPSEVVKEVADLLRSYGISRVSGDRYAANWATEAFSKEGVSYENSERDRSSIYLDVLPLFTSGRIRLLDSARLIYQFAGLERQVGRAGKDRVNHAEGGSDDLCNAAAGAAVLVASDGRSALIRPSDLLTLDQRAVEPHPYPEAFTATMWLDRQGNCGWTICSYRSVSGLEPLPLVLIDFDRCPFSMGVMDSIVARLDELHTAKIREQPGLLHRIAVVFSVPAQLVSVAQDLMDPTFGGRRRAMDEINLMRGQGPRIGADVVDALLVEQSEQLALDAAVFTALGKIKMSPTALERSLGRPLAGILSAPPGEPVSADPLRMAALIEIRGLGLAMQRPEGAVVRW